MIDLSAKALGSVSLERAFVPAFTVTTVEAKDLESVPTPTRTGVLNYLFVGKDVSAGDSLHTGVLMEHQLRYMWETDGPKAGSRSMQAANVSGFIPERISVVQEETLLAIGYIPISVKVGIGPVILGSRAGGVDGLNVELSQQLLHILAVAERRRANIERNYPHMVNRYSPEDWNTRFIMDAFFEYESASGRRLFWSGVRRGTIDTDKVLFMQGRAMPMLNRQHGDDPVAVHFDRDQSRYVLTVTNPWIALYWQELWPRFLTENEDATTTESVPA